MSPDLAIVPARPSDHPKIVHDAFRRAMADPVLNDSGTLGALVVLLGHRGNDSLACFPSLETIAGQLGCDRRSVSRRIRQLLKASILRHREPRRTAAGKRTSSLYSLEDGTMLDILFRAATAHRLGSTTLAVLAVVLRKLVWTSGKAQTTAAEIASLIGKTQRAVWAALAALVRGGHLVRIRAAAFSIPALVNGAHHDSAATSSVDSVALTLKKSSRGTDDTLNKSSHGTLNNSSHGTLNKSSQELMKGELGKIELEDFVPFGTSASAPEFDDDDAWIGDEFVSCERQDELEPIDVEEVPERERWAKSNDGEPDVQPANSRHPRAARRASRGRPPLGAGTPMARHLDRTIRSGGESNARQAARCGRRFGRARRSRGHRGEASASDRPVPVFIVAPSTCPRHSSKGRAPCRDARGSKRDLQFLNQPQSGA